MRGHRFLATARADYDRQTSRRGEAGRGIVGIGAAALLGYLRATGIRLELRRNARAYVGMGLFNAAIPFTLFAVALLTLNASYTSILNAATTFFTAIVAAVWIREPLTPRKLLGIVIGMLGVAVLVGFNPVPLSTASVVAVALTLLATLSYGIAAVFAKRNNAGIPAAAFAAGQQLAATALMTPFAAAGIALGQVEAPTPEAVGAAIAVGLFCTAMAYLLYFRLIANLGPTRALTVTFLIPVFGIAWGWLWLSEPLTPNMLAGFAMILIGMGLVLF